MKVFYNPKQSTEASSGFSPSARKPALLVKRWLDNNYPIEVISDFPPATREQFYRAHKKSHVDAILDCRKDNGFDNKSPEIAATLPWTTGSFMAAAKYALKHNTVTMSPTSGFHHATRSKSMGFCTFNGLMVTAFELLEQGANKVGILDLDHHEGNGTIDIIKWAEPRGIPEKSFHHYTVGGDPNFTRVAHIASLVAPREIRVWNGKAENWLKALPDIVNSFRGCDIVLFQAGADPHIDDPCHKMLLAKGALTNEQFVIRDRIVFEGLKKMDIPIAWNLAGGYQTPISKVLDIHTATLEAYLEVWK